MRVSRLGTDSSLPPDYQVFGAASELGRSILAAGQPSSFRPTTDRGCEAAIQGAAAHCQIRRRDQGRAVGDESASRNRKFESTSLQQGVCKLSVPRSLRLRTEFRWPRCSILSSGSRGCDRAHNLIAGIVSIA
jgi:hypothetical protein